MLFVEKTFLFKILTFMLIAIFYSIKISCISITYDFQPNNPVRIKNPLIWDISAICKIKTQDLSDVVVGRMINAIGKFDGKNVGDKLSITVRNEDEFDIFASGLASVEIINNGKNVVSAECTLIDLNKYNKNNIENTVKLIN